MVLKWELRKLVLCVKAFLVSFVFKLSAPLYDHLSQRLISVFTCNWHINNPFLSEMMFGPTNGRKLHYVITHVIRGKSDYRIVCVMFAMCTCKVWRNLLSHIYWSIRRHFGQSVDTLIPAFGNCFRAHAHSFPLVFWKK